MMIKPQRDGSRKRSYLRQHYLRQHLRPFHPRHLSNSIRKDKCRLGKTLDNLVVGSPPSHTMSQAEDDEAVNGHSPWTQVEARGRDTVIAV
mgnify:CR=1 FL=1